MIAAREQALVELLSTHSRLIVAFSGGVDSTYLLAVAADVLGERVRAATAVSPSLPTAERAAARRIAAQLGVEHLEVETDEMQRAAYRRNDPDRCWHCKTALFDALDPIVRAAEPTAVAVGTIADDLRDYRPGQRAAAQRGVLTPLADAGLEKADVRELSRRRGLPTWDKPAAACLASRVAYGLSVTPSRLARIERAEAWLRGHFGLPGNVRVRDHGHLASIEVDAPHIDRLATAVDVIRERIMGLGWAAVVVDPAGYRTGSLNAVLSDTLGAE